MSTVLSPGLQCTCGSTSMWARDHDAQKCDLWLDDEFANEMAYWSPQKTLIAAPIDWHPHEEDEPRKKERPAIEGSATTYDFENDPNWEKTSGGWRYVGQNFVMGEAATADAVLELRKNLLMSMNPDKMTDDEWWELEHILNRETANLESESKESEKKTVPPKATVKLECKCTPEHTWTCREIGGTRSGQGFEWKPMTPETRLALGVDKTDSTVVGKYGSTYTGTYTDYDGDWGYEGYVGLDRHFAQEVTFPDGTTVLASSQHTRKEGEAHPTMGIYAASSWNPSWCHVMVPWIDYDLPLQDFATVAWCIEMMYDNAKAGDVIEVGCIGGHGRTGTILACMAVLGGVKGTKAVDWVRKNYCEHAVESDRQKWFVRWFDCTRRGVRVPKMPEKHTWKSTKTTGKSDYSYSTTPCTEADHFRRIEEGKTSCWRTKCEWWEKDIEAYVKKHGSLPDPGAAKASALDTVPTHTKTAHIQMFMEGHDKCVHSIEGKYVCTYFAPDTKGLTRPKALQPRTNPGRRTRRNRKRRARRQHRRELMRTGTRHNRR